MLFKSAYDRTQTQLAYQAVYGDWHEAKTNPLIVWRKKQVYHKERLEAFINEEKTHLKLLNRNANSSSFGVFQDWKIVWKNNAIPTEIEWSRKTGNYFITVDLRITKNEGRIAQLSF